MALFTPVLFHNKWATAFNRLFVVEITYKLFWFRYFVYPRYIYIKEKSCVQ